MLSPQLGWIRPGPLFSPIAFVGRLVGTPLVCGPHLGHYVAPGHAGAGILLSLDLAGTHQIVAMPTGHAQRLAPPPPPPSVQLLYTWSGSTAQHDTPNGAPILDSSLAHLLMGLHCRTCRLPGSHRRSSRSSALQARRLNSTMFSYIKYRHRSCCRRNFKHSSCTRKSFKCHFCSQNMRRCSS